MKWSDFETRLRGEHLNGKRVVVTIARVEIEETHPRPGMTTNAPVLLRLGVRRPKNRQ